jgi:ATP synthase protein I
MFLGKPLRTVLRWQLITTAIVALLASFWWGVQGTVSAALGGLVNVTAGLAYGWIVSRSKGRSAGEVLQAMFRGWSVKVILIILQIWLVLTQYKDIVHASFFFAFVVTVGVFAAAFAVPDAETDSASHKT